MKGTIIVGLAFALLLATGSRSTATICTYVVIDGVQVCIGTN